MEWAYEEPSGSINQGDVFIPTQRELRDYFDVLEGDAPKSFLGFIVLSNTCDIFQKKIKYISLSPVLKLKETLEESNISLSKILGVAKSLSTYNKKELFYLPPSTELGINFHCLVKLEVSKSYLIEDVEQIILNRKICDLKSPFREKLGWAVGNLYNRVALDNDSEEDCKNIVSCFQGDTEVSTDTKK